MTTKAKHQKWLAIIEDQEKSGLAQPEYCKQHSIKISTLSYCRRIYKRKNPKLPKPEFKPVKIVNHEGHDIKLTLPNGFQLMLPIKHDATQIKQLIEVLLSC